jgi:hypothetical protein
MKPRRLYRSLWILVPASVVILVWLGMRAHVPEPDPATAERLEAAAERWWQPDGAWRYILKADWPAELQRIGAQAVTVAPKGVYIRFGSFFVEEWGLFILPKGSTFEPRPGGDPSYLPLRGRVYRYYIKG